MSDDIQCRTVGKVKWFNNKAGYGFISASEGELAGKDIFVHYSTINVANPQYKYLVQGEYVEFDVVKSLNESHEFQATNVSGIKGGSIMCETRVLSRSDNTEDRPRRVNRSSFRKKTSEPREESSNDGFVKPNKKRSKNQISTN
jgi:CspA family cold shock protein